MKRRHLLLGLSFAALVASQVQAQVTTDIAPDSDAGFDTGTMVVTNGTVTQIGGGELSGTNLFHSFAQFDLGNGDIATWVRGTADASSITNIINRVRSGTPSNIEGTITVADMPNADFWFINPAGVVFGDGASVQVPNAAYFSTAQEIGFGGGQRFSTVTPDGSTFSSAPPAAFGFLGGSAAIGLSGVVNSSSDMTLVGADVTVDGTLITFGTRFEAMAVGDGVEAISLSDPAQVTGNGQIRFLPGAGMGGSDILLTAENILLDDASINAIGAEGIRMIGGRIVIDNGSQIAIRDLQIATDGIHITADSLEIDNFSLLATSSNSTTTQDAGSITIDVGDLLITSSEIETRTSGLGLAGDISITANNATFTNNTPENLNNRSEIGSIASTGGSSSGNITIDVADRLTVDSSLISNTTFGSGDGGVIAIRAQNLEMINAGSIFAGTDFGTGNSGSINIEVETLAFGPRTAGNTIPSIEAATSGSGDAGTITITANSIAMGTDGRISTSTLQDATGDAGAIQITANVMTMDGGGIISAAQAGQSVDPGDAGTVTINVGTFEMNGGSIDSNTFNAGNAGNVTVMAENLSMSGFSRISATTASDGDAGSVLVLADNADLTGNASISSKAEAGSSGFAGSVSINVDGALTLTDRASIDAITIGSGNAGSVIVNADSVSLNVGAVPSDFSRISSNSEGSGDAGSVEVNARLVTIDDGVINSITTGTGDAGQVRINAQQFSMSRGFVSSTTQGQGDAGIVEVFADSVTVTGGAINSISQGAGDAGEVFVETGQLTMSGGFISSSVLFGSSGQGGNVFVQADNAELSGNAVINSEAIAGSTGDAGNVHITIDGMLSLAGDARIAASTQTAGNAGNVLIDTGGVLSLTDQATISTGTDGAGEAGNIFVTANSVLVEGDARISSQTTASGNAGSVQFDVADLLWLRGNSRVTSSTDGIGNTGNAGSVTIDAGTLRIDEDAQIDSSTREQALGDAGFVDIAVDLLEMSSGFIYTSTYGAGNAGTLTIEAGDIQLSGDGTINSRAVVNSTGNAGNVFVAASNIIDLSENSSISASTLGPGSAGLVSVETPLLVMTGGSIDSSTGDAGNAGNVFVRVTNAELSGNGRVTSNALLGSTGAAGNVFFDASQSLEIHDLAGIIAGTRGSGRAGLVDVNTPLLFMDGGVIASSTDNAGDAGDVLITADTAFVVGSAKVNSAALTGSTGNAGLVDINTSNRLVVADDAVISASTGGPGEAGAVIITTHFLDMIGGEIASFTRGGGDAGIVLIKAQDALLLSGASINSLADGDNTGDAGGVGISVAGQLVVAEGSTIAASTLGSGNAGKVGVSAGTLILDAGLITSATAGSGHAGDVVIAAEELQLLSDGSISSKALPFTTGNAGDVTVTVRDRLSIADYGSISASSEGTGFAGIVEVHASLLDMTGGAINSFTAGSGDAGLVGIFVDHLEMSGGRIDSASDSVAPGAGSAGSVLIQAGSANLSGAAQIDSRGITGNAGNVTLEVAGLLTIADSAQISAATDGSGHAGLVHVEADELIMTSGAINSFTAGSGDAGLVEVETRQLTMSGGRIDSSSDSDAADAGNAGGVFIASQNADLSGWAVVESLGVAGNAGDVRFEIADTLTLADDARISAAGELSGDAGSVFVIADLLAMSGGEINSLTNGSGRAGLVVLDLGELQMTGGRITSASQGPFPTANLSASIDPLAVTVPVAGDAGDVFLRANRAVLDGAVSIDSTSANSNAGGVAINIVEDLQLLNGAQVSTSAQGGGIAGSIDIVASQLRLDNFSQVSSTAEGDFAAGLITIIAEDIEILNGSQISTNSANGPAGDIVLLLPTDGVLRLAGEEFNGVITTSSGANTGGQIIISDPFLILSEGGSILALGEQGGANVQIQSAFFIRSSDRINLVSVDGSLLIESNVGEQITGTEVADIPFLDASGILSGQCSGVRQGGEISQFSSRVTGPYAPPDPLEEADDEMDGDAAGRIVRTEQGALAPCA